MAVNRTFACPVCSLFGKWIRFSTSVWYTPLNQHGISPCYLTPNKLLLTSFYFIVPDTEFLLSQMARMLGLQGQHSFECAPTHCIVTTQFPNGQTVGHYYSVFWDVSRIRINNLQILIIQLICKDILLDDSSDVKSLKFKTRIVFN